MHGILDGISSLHSWMKNQATTAAGGGRGGQRQERRPVRERIQTYDEVLKRRLNFKTLSGYSDKKMEPLN